MSGAAPIRLWSTFHDLVKSGLYTWVCCVIDGLDVYETEMHDILNQLRSLMDDAQYRFKLFCTSRPTELVEEVSISHSADSTSAE